MVPAFGRATPATIRANVLLPAPFSPTTACTSPGCRSRLRSARTGSAYVFPRPIAWKSGPDTGLLQLLGGDQVHRRLTVSRPAARLQHLQGVLDPVDGQPVRVLVGRGQDASVLHQLAHGADVVEARHENVAPAGRLPGRH